MTVVRRRGANVAVAVAVAAALVGAASEIADKASAPLWLLVSLIALGGVIAAVLAVVHERDAPRVEPGIARLQQPVRSLTPAREPGRAAVEARQVLEGEPASDADRLFDVTLANTSATQVLLATWLWRWQYLRGHLESIAKGELLEPLAEYVLALPVDIDRFTADPRLVEAAEQPISPGIVLPPADASGPSLVTVRLQVHYELVGRMRWHPEHDWDLLYEVSLRDERGDVAPVIPARSWRGRDVETVLAGNPDAMLGRDESAGEAISARDSSSP